MTILRVGGNMDWFRVAEQPSSIDQLPPVFSEMKKIWEEDPEKNYDRIVESLSPYIGGRFVADNLFDWEHYFDDVSDGEFEAIEVNVAGIDFSHEPLPLCKVEAVFEVPLRKGVSKEDVVDWGEDELFSAVVFYWNLEDFEDLDLTVGDHSGCEAYIL